MPLKRSVFSAISRNWISFIDWQKNRGVPAFLKVVTASWTLLATELPQGPWFWLDAAGVNPTLHHISDGSTLVSVFQHMGHDVAFLYTAARSSDISAVYDEGAADLQHRFHQYFSTSALVLAGNEISEQRT